MASSCSARVCKRPVSWLLSLCHLALRWALCWLRHSPSRTSTSSPFGPGALALLLASDAFAALSLVPWIKYRPALGREAIICERTGLYLLMVGVSVALVIGAVTLGRRIARQLGTGNATLISGGLYLAGIAAAMWLLPPVDEAPNGFSGYDRHAFMWRDLATQLVLWARGSPTSPRG